MPQLKINGISKRFGGLAAVLDFHMTVEDGEIVGLIGPNGAGKTTAFNMVNGFYTPDAGEILFDGDNITRLGPNMVCKKGIARAFQVVRPFGDMTVLDNVTIGALVNAVGVPQAREKAREVLEFVGLGDKASILSKSLTMAGRKRLELARALATNPKLLLLDEVMAGLTPRESDEAISLIRRIRDAGVTVFLIEHVMHAVMNLSDRVVVLNHGQKIMEGTPNEVANDERVITAYLGEEGTALA